MASSQDTTLENLIINDVDSESTLEDMVENNQIQPNQLYATPDTTLQDFAQIDAGNLSSADVTSWQNVLSRTKTIYDMTSNDSSINWGYTSGIQGGNTAINNKNFSDYRYLIITARQGVASMTSIMDLTTINPQTNTYNSGALGCEASDVDYCKFTVNSAKTEFTCNRLGYLTGNAKYDVVSSSAVCMKIVGVK